jgi:hypothetical protein
MRFENVGQKLVKCVYNASMTLIHCSLLPMAVVAKRSPPTDNTPSTDVFNIIVNQPQYHSILLDITKGQIFYSFSREY